jgi:hypothetical protein
MQKRRLTYTHHAYIRTFTHAGAESTQASNSQESKDTSDERVELVTDGQVRQTDKKLVKDEEMSYRYAPQTSLQDDDLVDEITENSAGAEGSAKMDRLGLEDVEIDASKVWIYVYVCVCGCVDVCMFVCVCVCVCVTISRVSIYPHTYTQYTCIHSAHMHKFLYICTYTQTQNMYIHSTRMHKRLYISTYTLTIYMQTYIHTRVVSACIHATYIHAYIAHECIPKINTRCGHAFHGRKESCYYT